MKKTALLVAAVMMLFMASTGAATSLESMFPDLRLKVERIFMGPLKTGHGPKLCKVCYWTGYRQYVCDWVPCAQPQKEKGLWIDGSHLGILR